MNIESEEMGIRESEEGIFLKKLEIIRDDNLSEEKRILAMGEIIESEIYYGNFNLVINTINYHLDIFRKVIIPKEHYRKILDALTNKAVIEYSEIIKICEEKSRD